MLSMCHVLFPQQQCQKGTVLVSLCMESLLWSIDFSQDSDRLVFYRAFLNPLEAGLNAAS